MKISENNNYMTLNKNYEVAKNGGCNIQNLVKTWCSSKSRACVKWKWFLPPVLAFVCYLNGLNGEFVHDDAFAIKRNGDVIGQTSLRDVFVHDFWGRPIALNGSHKSYRPITTLTFRYFIST